MFIKQTFHQCNDLTTKKQLAFILAREGIFLEEEEKNIKDNELTSENSIKSKKYDKYINKKISDISFIEQKKENIAFKRLNPDLKFIGKIIYNYKINKNNNNKNCSSINDINYLDMTNYKKRDDNLKFNDLRKYIIKIEKKIRKIHLIKFLLKVLQKLKKLIFKIILLQK